MIANIRLPGNGMARSAFALAKEDRGSFLLRIRHGILLTSRKPVKRGVGLYLSELEFRHGTSEHGEVDERGRGNLGEQLSEKLAVFGISVEPLKNFLADRLISKTAAIGWRYYAALSIVELIEPRPYGAGSAVKSGYLNQLRGRNMRLRYKQLFNNRVIGRETRHSLG